MLGRHRGKPNRTQPDGRNSGNGILRRRYLGYGIRCLKHHNVGISVSLKLLFLVSIFFALLAGGIWVVFLRPVPVKAAKGTITNKTFKPAGTYWQYPVGANRSFHTPTQIPIAEAYVFEISVEGVEGQIFYSLNTVASQAFNVGQ